MEIDFDNEGLLEGLDANERDSRRKLLEELAEDGFELEYLREAVEQNRLALLPVETVLGGEPQYTVEEVADKTQARARLLERLWNALGMPVAEPGEVCSVLASAEVKERVEDEYDWSFARKRKIKGIAGEVPVDRIRPAGSSEQS